ncbi:type II secretion system protein N [Seongchinamella sediminis]|uniref:type II secretion system protein N n=1 Tax=Seongchinamella sediminis TaxID=2283635 RepID=UPI0013C36399|nr:type II secretion system protein N [Seongchinamella sediminis]
MTGLAGGLVLALLLVATAPARILPGILPGQIKLQGLSGTLWQGHASRTLVAINGGWLQLGASEWRLSPLSLLLLSPGLELQSQWGRQTLRADLTLRSATDVDLEKVDLLLDAGLLRQFLPVALAGDIAAQFEHLKIRQRALQFAEGRVVWQGAGWLSPEGRRPLGSYAVDVRTSDEGVISGKIITLAGELQAQGDLRLQQSQYEIDLSLQGKALDDPQLRQALQLVAAPAGDGFRVELEGGL